MRSLILIAALLFTATATAQPLQYSAVRVDGVLVKIEDNSVLWLKVDGVVGRYKFEKLTDTPQPPPDPPDPPEDPPETDLTKFVETLTAEVEAADHGDVADVFRGIADRIKSGELRGSTAIGAATADSLLGVEDATGERPGRKAWQTWWRTLITHLVFGIKVDNQAEWESAYREIAKAVQP